MSCVVNVYTTLIPSLILVKVVTLLFPSFKNKSLPLLHYHSLHFLLYFSIFSNFPPPPPHPTYTTIIPLILSAQDYNTPCLSRYSTWIDDPMCMFDSHLGAFSTAIFQAWSLLSLFSLRSIHIEVVLGLAVSWEERGGDQVEKNHQQ